ncbi:spore cortex-lytic enzyme [Alteribacter lacisalsi]|uniref:Spore cortex-lytic enzyme n=1 Tax=Alteribacter lacisalsi TaxID=2045244 RepID=A0A2W0HLM3_9BACI|nr:cell wall hydrolase [Alteribacter lacisalsi]PYZ98445.1 spore cortex-lytic enzyme [Alteribacter lacisalsi]
MNKQKRGRLTRILVALLVCLQVAVMLPQDAEAFSDQVIQKGATGDDVVELQARLQYIGFYHDTIDGVYGWGTYWSVKKYQEEFGLDVDGLVGPKMKHMLEKSTDFDKEFVHRMLREGRMFTHYGGMSKEAQKGPKPGGKQPGPGKGKQPSAPKDPGKAAPAPGVKPSPETGEAPAPAPEAPEQPSAEEPAQQPEQPAPAPGEEAPEAVPEEGAEENIPDATPSPDEDAVPDDSDADIQEAINTPEGFTDNDIQIMAQAVYGEARGEPYTGQVAVAAVILNRIESPIFPNNPSGVIFEPRAFTAVADGQINLEPDDTARRAVLDAINGQDPSGNALYYFNPDTATSGWIWSRPQIKRIGKHIFCE